MTITIILFTIYISGHPRSRRRNRASGSLTAASLALMGKHSNVSDGRLACKRFAFPSSLFPVFPRRWMFVRVGVPAPTTAIHSKCYRLLSIDLRPRETHIGVYTTHNCHIDTRLLWLNEYEKRPAKTRVIYKTNDCHTAMSHTHCGGTAGHGRQAPRASYSNNCILLLWLLGRCMRYG